VTTKIHPDLYKIPIESYLFMTTADPSSPRFRGENRLIDAHESRIMFRRKLMLPAHCPVGRVSLSWSTKKKVLHNADDPCHQPDADIRRNAAGGEWQTNTTLDKSLKTRRQN
jgi:hypothetical protein